MKRKISEIAIRVSYSMIALLFPSNEQVITGISNAVTYIEATYRWCLTGTPITNSLADCYAFMRFLEIRPWYGV